MQPTLSRRRISAPLDKRLYIYGKKVSSERLSARCVASYAYYPLSSLARSLRRRVAGAWHRSSDNMDHLGPSAAIPQNILACDYQANRVLVFLYEY